ncbi:hypothetical protein HK097_005975 [Rhizophlyctis rosea]|uniref:Ion transport domain-containing protein n=1 Tax=Rhizophlyctis rosea TaxID=64517 RepID=A0AAD5SF61_9FUNG|nr:hypothetical protein HK097_005975 [Rhizophlyctis rosea]
MSRSVEEGRALLEEFSRTLQSARQPNEPQASQASRCYVAIIKLSAARIPSHAVDNPGSLVDHETIRTVQQEGGPAAIYAALAAFRRLQARADTEAQKLITDAGGVSVVRSRGEFCEALAVKLVRHALFKAKVPKEELFIDMLTSRFPKIEGQPDELESALEVAVSSAALNFVNEESIRECVEYIWNGRLMPHPNPYQTPDPDSGYIRMYLSPPEGPRTGFAALADGRLRVPAYLYAAETFFNFVLLAVFTWVVNERTADPGFMEWLMYILVIAAAFDEIRQMINEGLQFYFLTLWNVIDITVLSLFFAAAFFRILGEIKGQDDVYGGYVDLSYDLLSVNAVFLWFRVVNVLSGINYFGEMVIIVRAMVRDALIFFVLYFFVLAGFTQAFVGLTANASEVHSPIEILALLSRAVLQAPDFDRARDTHPTFGEPLMVLYMVLGAVILVNMLVAFFNQSYSDVVAKAREEHLLHFSIKVLSFYKRPDDHPFPPPFNLLDATLFPIPRLLCPTQIYSPAEGFIWYVVLLPLHLSVAVYEELNTLWRKWKGKEHVAGELDAYLDAPNLEDVSGETSDSEDNGEAEKVNKELLDLVKALVKEVGELKEEVRKA